MKGIKEGHPKDIQVVFMIDITQSEKLSKICDRHKMKRSEAMRYLIEKEVV